MNAPRGKVISVNISSKKGTGKKPVDEIILKENFGVMGDAHSNTPVRQVSLLAAESINKIKAPDFNPKPGDFAENVTFSGLDTGEIKIGAVLKIGSVQLEISQIGKECHTRCAIYKKIGNCIMPKEGFFATVKKGGKITQGMDIELL